MGTDNPSDKEALVPTKLLLSAAFLKEEGQQNEPDETEKQKYGWPVDEDGNPIIPPFSHAAEFYIECWECEQNKNMGVRGSLAGCFFRWSCERLQDLMGKLEGVIVEVWGEDSIGNFEADPHEGQPALDRPEDLPERDDCTELHPFLYVTKYPRIERVTITFDCGDSIWELYFDELGANYMLKWLKAQFTACCLAG